MMRLRPQDLVKTSSREQNILCLLFSQYWSRIRFLAGMTILHFTTGVGCLVAATTLSHCEYSYLRKTMFYEGREVTVEYYVPKGDHHFPLVLMLHGSAGAYTRSLTGEPLQDNFGEKRFASSCFTVVFPHYFEGLGYKSLTSPSLIRVLFPELYKITETCLIEAEKLPNVKGQPVLLFGESLGAYLGVALALQHREIMSISEMSGGIPEGYEVRPNHVFSVMIFHGDSDHNVPIGQAEDLLMFCKIHKLSCTEEVFSQVGHYFPQAILDHCIARTIEAFTVIAQRQ